MPAYVIVLMEEVSDPEALTEYRRIGLPTLADRDVKFRVRLGEFEVLEGAPVEAVLMLEFPTMDAARDWHESPAYKEALKVRRRGVKCHSILVQGAEA